MLHGDQLRSGGRIGVPEIVVNGLEMPEPLSGAGIERQHAIRVEVVAGTVAAVEFVLGGRGVHVSDAPSRVDRDLAPHIDAAHVLVGALGPGIVACFAGPRDGVKDPHQLTGYGVKGADIAGRREIALACRAAKNDQGFENAARGS